MLAMADLLSKKTGNAVNYPGTLAIRDQHSVEHRVHATIDPRTDTLESDDAA